MLNIDTRLYCEKKRTSDGRTVYERKLTADEYFLLSIRADFIDKDRQCFPNTSTLLSISGWSKSTLLRVKASLKAKGLIEITNRRRSDNQMQFESNLYTIKTPLINKFSGKGGAEPRSNSDTTLVLNLTPPGVKNGAQSIRTELLLNTTIRKEEMSSFDDVRAALFGDEQWIERIRMAHSGKDFEQALKECYLHHSQSPSPPRELWQWRQKYNTWLSISKPKSSSNGKKSNPKDEHTRGLAEDFARRYGT